MVTISRKFFWITALAVLTLDQLLKYVLSTTTTTLDCGFVSIQQVQNTGAGFGILQDQTFWLGLVSLAVAVGILFNYQKIPLEKMPLFWWGLFLGGVVGNMVDRLWRGYVIDFIDFGFWPAFNIADAAITVAAVGLVVYYWKK